MVYGCLCDCRNHLQRRIVRQNIRRCKWFLQSHKHPYTMLLQYLRLSLIFNHTICD